MIGRALSIAPVWFLVQLLSEFIQSKLPLRSVGRLFWNISLHCTFFGVVGMRAYRWYRNHCEKVIRSTRETATDPGQYREQVQRSGGIDLGGVFASFLLVVCLIIFTVWVAAKVVLSLSPGSDSIIGRIA